MSHHEAPLHCNPIKLSFVSHPEAPLHSLDHLDPVLRNVLVLVVLPALSDLGRGHNVAEGHHSERGRATMQ